jgi:dipeptidase E
MFDRFSENSKKLMSRARNEALQLAHDYIAPEHMLLALLSAPDCTALTIVRQLGVEPEELTLALKSVLVRGATPVQEQTLLFTPEAKKVLQLTLEEAASLSHSYLGTEHLLLGLLGAPGIPAEVMRKLGVTAESARSAITGIVPVAQRSRLRLLLISNSTMHGGGYLEHCASEIRDFLGPKKRVLFVPYALFDHDAYAERARLVFTAMGHDFASVHTKDHAPAALGDADAVFIGGGNTFRLLTALIHYGLLQAIQQRALAGMPYIGSSAGTNVATLSIRTTNDMPIVQPPTFTAMQLVPFQINPHFLDADPGSKHMGETREDRIRQFHEEHSTPVLGLREGCMLRIEGDKMELRGSTNARLFQRGKPPEEFAPPCDLSFLVRA